MALLFVGGVMNLVWVALLAVLVLVEKVVPNGRRVSALAGVVLIIWGMATLLHAGRPIVHRADANAWQKPSGAVYCVYIRECRNNMKDHGGSPDEQPVACALPFEGRG